MVQDKIDNEKELVLCQCGRKHRDQAIVLAERGGAKPLEPCESEDTKSVLRFKQSLGSFLLGRLRRTAEVEEEYFAEDVTKFLTGEIQRRIRTDPGKQLPRPTMLWHDIKSLMGSVRHVESYVNINMAEVLENVLIDQTIADDVSQNATVSAAYIQFYLNLVFGITPQGGICVSTSKKAFVSLAPGPIKAEEYTDVQELQALFQITR